MKSIFIFFILLCVSTTYAQDPTDSRIQNQRTLDDFYSFQKGNVSIGNSNIPEGTEGSPYLTEEFIKGEILLVNGQTYQNIPLRYNIYNDAIEYKYKDVVAEITNLEKIAKVRFGGHSFVKQAYTARGKFFSAIMQELNSGDYRFLIKHTVKFKDSEPPAAYQEAKPPRFERIGEKHFLSVKQQPASQFDGKGELFKQLGPFEEEGKNYFKKNKLRVNREEDLIRFATWLNQH